MNRKFAVASVAAVALAAGIAWAQYPIMDMVAQKVVQKYQSSTCEQLWASKGQHGPEEQRLVAMLGNDPQKRQQFFNQISGPVVNEMFECGMIP